MPTSAGWSGEGRTLYSQVAEQVEALALAGPLGEATMLPAELELAEQLGVSRGTLRRAIADLERSGLLSREQGRGTFVNPAARLAVSSGASVPISATCNDSAACRIRRPTIRSRIGLDGAAQRRPARLTLSLGLRFLHLRLRGKRRLQRAVRGFNSWRNSDLMFITPDNNTADVRRRAIADGKRFLMTTYGIRRGFLLAELECSAAARGLALDELAAGEETL